MGSDNEARVHIALAVLVWREGLWVTELREVVDRSTKTHLIDCCDPFATQIHAVLPEFVASVTRDDLVPKADCRGMHRATGHLCLA